MVGGRKKRRVPSRSYKLTRSQRLSNAQKTSIQDTVVCVMYHEYNEISRFLNHTSQDIQVTMIFTFYKRRSLNLYAIYIMNIKKNNECRLTCLRSPPIPKNILNSTIHRQGGTPTRAPKTETRKPKAENFADKLDRGSESPPFLSRKREP